MGDPTDYARTSVTQVITLSSAILGISITFAKNFSTNHVPGLLTASWICYVVAIVLGLLCLSGLTGLVMGDKSINEQPFRALWIFELLAFAVGMILFMITAFEVY